ncbi:MAG: hypothetical protein ACYDBB_03355 [Armatimonadota bacterium]
MEQALAAILATAAKGFRRRSGDCRRGKSAMRAVLCQFSDETPAEDDRVIY